MSVVFLTSLGTAEASSFTNVTGSDGQLEYHPSLSQTRSELESFFVTIENHYGPLALKQKTIGLDWEKTKQIYRDRLDQTTSAKNIYFLFGDLLGGFNDAHVSITLPSTLEKTLPLQFSFVENKIILNFIDNDSSVTMNAPEAMQTLAIGDELVAINGVPWRQVMASQPVFHKFGNDLTNQALFARQLSSMKEEHGLRLSSAVDEKVSFSFIRAKDGSRYSVQMKYQTKGRAIADRQFPQLNLAARIQLPLSKTELLLAEQLQSLNPSQQSQLRDVQRLMKAIHKTFNLATRLPSLSDTDNFSGNLSGSAEKSDSTTTGENNGKNTARGTKIEIGQREPFFKLPDDFKEISFPLLGALFNANSFYAGVFQHNGKRVGFLRIPNYMPSTPFTILFGLRYYIGELEKNSDYLIIDQTNNPGGMVAFTDLLVHSLVGTYNEKSHLRYRVKPSQGFLRNFDTLIDTIEAGGGSTLLPKETNASFLAAFKVEYGKVLSAYEKGESLSEPISLLVTSQFMETLLEHVVIAAAPYLQQAGELTEKTIFKHQVYTKPIYFLINELDFSGGDATPAMLQDYGRARLIGVRTAGAGGTVEEFTHRGTVEFGYSLTTSLMYRKNGVFVENYGVSPDLEFKLSVDDYRTDFKNTLSRLLKTIAADQKELPGSLQLK